MREKATYFLSQVFASAIIIPLLVAFIAWVLLPNANLPYMLLGALASVVLAVGFGILPRVFSYFRDGMAAALGFGVFFGSVLSVLMGIYSSVAGSTDPDAIAAVVDSPTGLAVNAVLLGTVLGMFIRIFVGSGEKDVRKAMLAGLIIIVPLALIFSLFSKPNVIVTNRLGSIFMLLAFTGWFILPFQIAISLINTLLVRIRPASVPRLWQFAPVNWDDFMVFPALDTVPLLVKLHDVDRSLYGKALERVRQHPFQFRYARIAQQRVNNQ
jgi:hypothetical protein